MDASEPANTSLDMYCIAPVGDIVLVVGNQGTRLRVHSVCMRNVSKVFDAMFGPHFSKGQPSSGGSPKEIAMPDDDASAMTIVCNVIHHRNDVLPDVLEASELVQLALVADKYDCALTLRYVMIQWLDFKDPVPFASLGHLLIAVYVIDNPDAFWRITHLLINGTAISFQFLVDKRYDEIIPWSVYCKCKPVLGKLFLLLIALPDLLEAARTRTRLLLQDVLLKEMEYKKRGCCDHASKRAYAHMQALRRNSLWGASLFDMAINTAIEKARKMVHPTFREDDWSSSCAHHKQQQTQGKRHSRLDDVSNFAGLCLGCVRSGNAGAYLSCDITH